MGSMVLPTLTTKRAVDTAIRDTLDKVLVLRFGRAGDATCLHLDDILLKASRDISRFGEIALVDMDSEEIQVYVNYFDITLSPCIIFFFNAHHMKMDSGHNYWALNWGTHRAQFYKVQRPQSSNQLYKDQIAIQLKTADHTKWIGSFHNKQDFIDVVEAIYRGAMKGKLIVTCPIPPERIKRFDLLFKDL